MALVALSAHAPRGTTIAGIRWEGHALLRDGRIIALQALTGDDHDNIAVLYLSSDGPTKGHLLSGRSTVRATVPIVAEAEASICPARAILGFISSSSEEFNITTGSLVFPKIGGAPIAGVTVTTAVGRLVRSACAGNDNNLLSAMSDKPTFRSLRKAVLHGLEEEGMSLDDASDLIGWVDTRMAREVYRRGHVARMALRRLTVRSDQDTRTRLGRISARLSAMKVSASVCPTPETGSTETGGRKISAPVGGFRSTSPQASD
jgi:hypothetical protein